MSGPKWLQEMRDERDDLKAKLADSEREREALQKAHDLLNVGFESATEQMHELKQAIRGSEAARQEAADALVKLLDSSMPNPRMDLAAAIEYMIDHSNAGWMRVADERVARLKAEAACAAKSAALRQFLTTIHGNER